MHYKASDREKWEQHKLYLCGAYTYDPDRTDKPPTWECVIVKGLDGVRDLKMGDVTSSPHFAYSALFIVDSPAQISFVGGFQAIDQARSPLPLGNLPDLEGLFNASVRAILRHFGHPN